MVGIFLGALCLILRIHPYKYDNTKAKAVSTVQFLWLNRWSSDLQWLHVAPKIENLIPPLAHRRTPLSHPRLKKKCMDIEHLNDV